MRTLLSTLFALCLGANLQAAELVVELGPDQVQRYESMALLQRSDVQTIEIPEDVAYRQAMRYRAIPLRALLAGVQHGQAIQISATDGFVAELDSTPLLQAGPDQAQAWLAIEPEDEPWPSLGADGPSAGPFYVVWTQPQASGISPEQWPYQTAVIRAAAPLSERFPAMLPAAEASAQVQQGWEVFRVNCMVCHTMNRQGAASMGPDLNVPHSPVEYFSGDFLRRYIRDPAALRYWPTATMPAFSAEVLPEADLDALLAYLQHMSAHKAAAEHQTAPEPKSAP